MITLEYYGHLRNVRLTDTLFEARLNNLAGRITLPSLMPWHGVFRQYRLDPASLPHADLWVFQVAEDEGTDNVTGQPIQWRGRRWILSRHMEDAEIVRTVLMAYLAAVEHEVREQLTVDGERIFDPHWSLDNQIVATRTMR